MSTEIIKTNKSDYGAIIKYLYLEGIIDKQQIRLIYFAINVQDVQFRWHVPVISGNIKEGCSFHAMLTFR